MNDNQISLRKHKLPGTCKQQLAGIAGHIFHQQHKHKFSNQDSPPITHFATAKNTNVKIGHVDLALPLHTMKGDASLNPGPGTLQTLAVAAHGHCSPHHRSGQHDCTPPR
jgi:hypothetical protein